MQLLLLCLIGVRMYMKQGKHSGLHSTDINIQSTGVP